MVPEIGLMCLQGCTSCCAEKMSGMRDIDLSELDRWCEYILCKGLKRPGYVRVSRRTTTDTKIQVGKFMVVEPEGAM
jgi:hypothetical protein